MILTRVNGAFPSEIKWIDIQRPARRRTFGIRQQWSPGIEESA
jgi:hypothetical protein